MKFPGFDLTLPFPDIFPASWEEKMRSHKPCEFMSFRNLSHFKHVVSDLTQRENMKCNMSYADALDMLIKGKSDFPKEEQASIRNLVRSNLHKRGLITDEVYEAYRYTVDGTQVGVDIGKYASGDPDCVISPARDYVDFFYELYVSISYPYNIPDSAIRENIAKLLATVEELERKHVYIKITLVFPDINVASVDARCRNFLSTIPLFSHKDPKSVESMSAVLNDRLLRKFFFAIIEKTYGDTLAGGYGMPTDLEGTMNVGKEFNEIEFFETVMNEVGA